MPHAPCFSNGSTDVKGFKLVADPGSSVGRVPTLPGGGGGGVNLQISQHLSQILVRKRTHVQISPINPSM